MRAGIAHRDLRWPNIIKVVEDGQHCIKVIDFEKSGQLGAVCSEDPYPLQHWVYNDDAGTTVLEPGGAYSARSDFKMIGKCLMAPLRCLGADGQQLRERLEAGDYQVAADVLAHAWFTA